ncbi:MAG: SulP family inorganic anion transporter [Salibacteraceae bacterium]
MSTNNPGIFANIKSDLPSSIVVFLVAMPLCLGIALASGAPLYAGIISGIVGGIVVGSFSGSALGVSGPAAGLAVIVLSAINDMPSYEIFLVAVILAGAIQLIMGYIRAGIIGYYFPSSVIHGMLTGIGILIFLKQLPHAFGYDADTEGDLEFIQADGHNTFSELYYMLENVTPGAAIITAISLVILITWETKFMKNLSFTKIIPGPLVAVVTGILLNIYFASIPSLSISSDHLVSIPVPETMNEFLGNFRFPDFSGLLNVKVYVTALIIAVVASLETLLSLEAADKLDPQKRISPANRELKAQGIGNIVAGFIGGIPVTQVIVRSSANVQTGGKSKLSTIMHGIWLLLSIIFIPQLLNKIPLATLAAVLLTVGYKLAKPAKFKQMYNQGMEQFLPFMVTIIAMILSDLLIGIGLGLIVAIFVILKNNLKTPFSIMKGELEDKHNFKMILSEDVTFLNKAALQNALASLPNDTHIIIDGSNCHYMHHDVKEILEDFEINAHSRNILFEKIGFSKINDRDTPTHFELKDLNSK